MKKMIKPLTITIAACLAMSGFALTVSHSTEPPQVNPSQIEAPAKNDIQMFHGVVKEDGDGVALYTDKEIYPLIGGEFDLIKGKEVNITGTIVEEGNIKRLAVKRIQLNK